MYTTTRKITGSTLMACKDCGLGISMNKICEKPIQAATDMLKHMAAHNASRAFVVAGRVMGPEPEAIRAGELLPTLSALQQQVIASIPQSPN
jgi:hypothetical protein